MAGTANKSKWTLLLVLLSGIVLGGFIGYLCRDISWLSWLNYGQTFGLVISINIASIIGVVIGILIYKKL